MSVWWQVGRLISLWGDDSEAWGGLSRCLPSARPTFPGSLIPHRFVINYISQWAKTCLICVYQMQNQQAPTRTSAASVDEPIALLLADPERWNCIPYSQQYVLRKETIAYGSEIAMKRLNRESALAKQQYRRKAAENRDAKMELDYESYPIKRQFAKLREMYSTQSNSSQLMKKNLDKLKTKVDKVTKEIRNKDAMNVKDSDIVKIYKISTAPQRPPRPAPEQK